MLNINTCDKAHILWDYCWQTWTYWYLWLANNFSKEYDVEIPCAAPTVLEKVALENRELSVDCIFSHKFSFDFIMVASAGNLQFNSRLVTKITTFFVLFRHCNIKSILQPFEIKPSQIFLYAQHVCEKKSRFAPTDSKYVCVGLSGFYRK